MRYINKKTGAVIDSPDVINGLDWTIEGLQNSAETVNEEKEEIKDDLQDEPIEDGYENMTKEDIKRELDALGIEYNNKFTKLQLIELMTKRN